MSKKNPIPKIEKNLVDYVEESIDSPMFIADVLKKARENHRFIADLIEERAEDNESYHEKQTALGIYFMVDNSINLPLVTKDEERYNIVKKVVDEIDSETFVGNMIKQLKGENGNPLVLQFVESQMVEKLKLMKKNNEPNIGKIGYELQTALTVYRLLEAVVEEIPQDKKTS